MTHRGPFQPRTLCDSVISAKLPFTSSGAHLAPQIRTFSSEHVEGVRWGWLLSQGSLALFLRGRALKQTSCLGCTRSRCCYASLLRFEPGPSLHTCHQSCKGGRVVAQRGLRPGSAPGTGQAGSAGRPVWIFLNNSARKNGRQSSRPAPGFVVVFISRI